MWHSVSTDNIVPHGIVLKAFDSDTQSKVYLWAISRASVPVTQVQTSFSQISGILATDSLYYIVSNRQSIDLSIETSSTIIASISSYIHDDYRCYIIESIDDANAYGRQGDSQRRGWWNQSERRSAALSFLWMITTGKMWHRDFDASDHDLYESPVDISGLLGKLNSLLRDKDGTLQSLREEWSSLEQPVTRALEAGLESGHTQKSVQTFLATRAIQQYLLALSWNESRIAELAVNMHLVDTHDDCVIPLTTLHAMLTPADTSIASVLGLHTSAFESTVDYGRKII